MELIFQEGDLLVKTIDTPGEMDSAYRLRHEVFSEELRWVPTTPDRRETDDYDGFARCIGVFDEAGKILGHARLIPSPHPFMVEKEFREMLPPERPVRKGPDLAEITRLCVKKEVREGQGVTVVANYLYKAIYLLSIMNDIRHLVMVVDRRYYRLLRLTGFPMEPLGDFITMPDGVKAGAIWLDLRRLEEVAGRKKPDFMKWMSTLPGRYPLPGRLRALY